MILLNETPIEKNKKDCVKIMFMPDLQGMIINLTIDEYVSYLALLSKEDKTECLKSCNLF